MTAQAPFDLKAMQPILGRTPDLDEWVERGRVWDTQILRRLLALATEGSHGPREIVASTIRQRLPGPPALEG